MFCQPRNLSTNITVTRNRNRMSQIPPAIQIGENTHTQDHAIMLASFRIRKTVKVIRAITHIPPKSMVIL